MARADMRRPVVPSPAEVERARLMRERTNALATRIERLLGLEPETIATFGWRVLLTPDEADALLALVPEVCRCPECGCPHQPN